MSINHNAYQKITLHDLELHSRDGGGGNDEKQNSFSSSADLDFNGQQLVSDLHFKQKYSFKSYFKSLPLFGACVNFVNSIVGAGTASS
jgi:hypothetical protein